MNSVFPPPVADTSAGHDRGHHACRPVLLIASGAYVEPELEAEFGPLPPAFLPFGNRRLFTHQHAAFGGAAERVLLSLPQDFRPSGLDTEQLDALGVELVPVPSGLTLGQSLVHVVNATAVGRGPLVVLHGDTLLHGVETDLSDVVSVDTTARPGYRWGYVHETGGCLELADDTPGAPAAALTGLFGFADPALLVQAITCAGGDFLRGLAAYSRLRPIRTVVARQWLDFGHASTFHQSRQASTTERAFNHLRPTGAASSSPAATRRRLRPRHAGSSRCRLRFASTPPPISDAPPARAGSPTASNTSISRRSRTCSSSGACPIAPGSASSPPATSS